MAASSEESRLTIPNLISLYRLCAAPFIFCLIVAEKRELFGIFITISLISDVLDGLVARLLHQQTRFGSRLDSFADELTFAVALIGVFVFERDSLGPDIAWVYGFLVCYALSSLVPFLRFGKLPAFHLYSFRAAGYLLTANFILLFTVGYFRGFLIFTMIFASIAALEVVAVALCLDEFRTNQRGLYWVLKARRSPRA